MNTSTPSSAGPARLGILFSETFEYCKAHWQSLAVGVAIFGVVTGLLAAAIGAKAGQTVMRGMDRMGIDTDRMERLADRMEAGDETAMGELEALLEAEFGDMTDEQIQGRMMGPVGGMVREIAPVAGVGMIVSWLISMLAYAYYALVAVEGKDVKGTFARAKSVMLPLFGVNFWAMLRSFVWIPIVGLIPALILGPRFVAAPLVHLTEGKGVTASVSESYRRTRGYWAKIVGNMIVAILVALLASIVVGMVFGLLFSSVLPVMAVAKQLVQQAATAFLTVFSVRLSHTILRNPRA